jgi:hypothetical protein
VKPRVFTCGIQSHKRPHVNLEHSHVIVFTHGNYTVLICGLPITSFDGFIAVDDGVAVVDGVAGFVFGKFSAIFTIIKTSPMTPTAAATFL